MINITAQDRLAVSILGKQKIKPDIEYRLIAFSLMRVTADGTLLYNLLTKELILLSDTEKKILAFGRINYTENAFVKRLIEGWFLVPVDNDDIKLCDSVIETARLLKRAMNKSIFTIMTTADCNARCFYCYEAGRKRIPMTEKTAYAVADFIQKKSGGEAIQLYWFGGEPLYNSKVIDIICKSLSEKKLEFQSKMVTNGYLFDEQYIKKAVELWNLKGVQITLDGTEEVYNRCKAYVYEGQESPFKIVINNIKLLLEAGIKVNIRLNMDIHNESDLYKLCDFLADKFSDYKKFNVYAALLFENCALPSADRSDEQQHNLMMKFSALQNYMFEKGISTAKLPTGTRTNRCMADDDARVVIAPDGNLGKCEHFSESEFFGNIYNDNYDAQMINSWKEEREKIEECEKCPFYPECFYLKKCPDVTRECNEDNRNLKRDDFQRAMLSAYKAYKENQIAEE